MKERSLIEKYTGQINYLSHEFNKINTRREALFENFIEGLLDEAEYQFAKQKYDAEADEIQKKLVMAKNRKQQVDEVLSLDNEWIKALHRVEHISEINMELVDCMVKLVKVYEDKRVEVELNYAEQKSVFEQIIAELEGDERE